MERLSVPHSLSFSLPIPAFLSFPIYKLSLSPFFSLILSTCLSSSPLLFYSLHFFLSLFVSVKT